MRTKQITQNEFTEPLEWPRVDWKRYDWWTITSVVLGLIVFMFPDLPAANAPKINRLYIGIPLISIPLSFPILIWLFKICNIIRKRTINYPRLHKQTIEARYDIVQLRNSLSDFVKQQFSREREFEILRVTHENGKIIIVLQKRDTPEINRDDQIVVFDTEDYYLMGIFTVISVKTNEIYALGIRNVDPVWAGFILKKEGEILSTPFLSAIYLPKETQ